MDLTEERIDVATEQSTESTAAKETHEGTQCSFSIDVLRLTKASQSQYGLRYGNYQIYRKYCGRKLLRLRKSLHLSGGARKYQTKEITPEMVVNERYLYVPLFQAERAWAYAMQMKDEHSVGELPSRVRLHIIRKFTKAVKHAENLVLLSKGKVDSKTQLEVEAYCKWMKGIQSLEKENYEDALQELVHARKIYEEMSKIGDSDEQELSKGRVGEIDTSLRYCNLKLKGAAAGDISDLIASAQKSDSFDILSEKLEAALQETRKQQAQTMEKVTWRGKTVQIKSDKLRIAFVKQQELSYDLDRTTEEYSRQNIFAQLFLAYGDTLDIIRAELHQLQDSVKNEKLKSAKVSQEEANLKFLLLYVTHLKLTKSLERNEKLADLYFRSLMDKAKEKGRHVKPDDLVRLYDNMIQHIADLEETKEEDDVDFAKQCAAKGLSYKAWRCFFVALSYAKQKEWQKALALCERSLSLADSARQHHLACGKPSNDEIQRLEQLVKAIRGQKCVIFARSYVEQGALPEVSDESAESSSTVLLDVMDQFKPELVKRKRLAHFPPECSAAPCKPVLFDVAQTYVEFPSLDQRATKKSFWKWW